MRRAAVALPPSHVLRYAMLMGVRGQSSEAWVSRFRSGACPIHGTALVVVDDVTGAVACTNVDPAPCTVRARRLAGKDRFHHVFAWVAGPDDVRAALRKGNDIDDDGAPTRWSRQVRTSYPLGDLDLDDDGVDHVDGDGRKRRS